MTIAELEEKINSIDVDSRPDGRYTEDEIYELGLAFIEMTRTEKKSFGGWDRMVELLEPRDRNGNIMIKGDTLRAWVNDKRYVNGDMNTNVALISGQTIEDISYPEFEEKVEDLKRGLFKQQVKTRDTMNSYRRTLRDDARVETMKDLIAESIKSLKTLPEVTYDGEWNGEDAEAVVLFSDLHIGMEVDNFYNKYNVEIAKKRVKKYVQDVITTCHRNNVKKLNFLNLGDAIHGIIHTTARIESNEDVISQVMIASEIIAEALVDLQEAAPEVVYRSCSDNHARVMSNFRENIEKENFFRLIDFYLEARLKDTNVKIVHDNLDVDLGYFELLNGKKMMFAHGHRDNINTAIQGVLGATKQFIDYVCVGHFHESKMKSFQGAKVFVNGSICGSDSYAQSKRLYGNAEQTLLIFGEEGNLSVNYIDLDSVKK